MSGRGRGMAMMRPHLCPPSCLKRTAESPSRSRPHDPTALTSATHGLTLHVDTHAYWYSTTAHSPHPHALRSFLQHIRCCRWAIGRWFHELVPAEYGTGARLRWLHISRSHLSALPPFPVIVVQSQFAGTLIRCATCAQNWDRPLKGGRWKPRSKL